jgi:hypothetical protein
MTNAPGPCPHWCAGVHDPETGSDQFHQSAPIGLDVTADGSTVRILEASLTQYPNAEGASRDVYVPVDLGGGDIRAMDAPLLHALANGLESHAEQLRELAARVIELRAVDRGGRATGHS